jgi:hypothetical protein
MSSSLPPDYFKLSIFHTSSGACVFECERDEVSSPNSRGTFAVVKVLQQLSRDVDFGNLSRSIFIPRAVGSDQLLITAMSQRFTVLLWISCELQASLADSAGNWAADVLQNFEAAFGDEAADRSMNLPDAEASPDLRVASESQLLELFSSFSSSLQHTATSTSFPRKAKV